MTSSGLPYVAVTRALEGIEFSFIGSLSDADLLELVGLSAQHERLSRAHSATLVGELARRSAPELGHDGLAQRLGHRTPQKLVQATTGASGRDAAQTVRVGSLEHSHPWLAPVSGAIASGTISTDAADAIRAGLGQPTWEITPDLLSAAAAELRDEAVSIDVDTLFAHAREVRDQLDETGIVDRERAAHEARSFRLQRQRDGGVRIVWQLDPVEGSVISEVYDRATSPRRGGPRMLTQEQHAQQIIDDPRTTEQLSSDVFLHLVTAGAEVDPSRLLGTGTPAVRVLVTADNLTSRAGHGRLQRSQSSVSIETVERAACSNGTVPVVFDSHGRALDVGREQRLFTSRQRVALGARDGGCLWTGCERPPSWCEAHHIDHWARDHGRTDVADGVLLCKHHHLLLHDHHWEIERRGQHREEYWLVPPPDHPDPEPRRLVSTSLALRDLLAG